MLTNQEKALVWQAYRERKPTRVPVTFGVNARVVLFDPDLNPQGITFEEYYNDPAATIGIQLKFLEYTTGVLNQYNDNPVGWPAEFAFSVDNQNTYDSQYFGAPIAFRAGQVADVVQPYTGADKDKIFGVDIDHPLDNPFIQNCLRRHAALTKAAAKVSFHGVRFTVNPVLMGYDGHLTMAANLRGGEIFTDLYEDPEYCRRFFDVLHRGAILRNRALAAHFGKPVFDGPSGSFADDSIALISTDMYRRHLLPFHRAWYALWSEKGPHSIHLCGDATRHFPTICQELHVYSFDTGFPVDFGRLRQAVGPEVEILGGPDVALLLSGRPAQVYDRAKAILTSGIMRGGRFTLREGNNLPPGVPVANLAAMYQAALDHGNY